MARAFVEAGKPVATICHGPWTLLTTSSRSPADLPAFCAAIVEQVAKA